MEHWLFNTDETEPEGEGKYAVMLKQQVVAAWGHCKGLGAEVTLNRPNPGDIVFYFRAGFGIIARAEAVDSYSSPSQSVFGAVGEYRRPVDNLQVLPEDKPITVAEITESTGYQIPYRQIMGRILDASTVDYLNRRFRSVKSRSLPSKKAIKQSSGGFFQTAPEERKKVEVAAVSAVTKAYEAAEWQVKSVEREKVGYDLHCTKGDKFECVEVKGTSGPDEQFIITANELNKAKTDPRFVLFVVTNALTKPTQKKYSGQQLISKFDIQPLQYRAVLRSYARQEK